MHVENGRSLLESTQNTRDLGGYRSASGSVTRSMSLLRSDVQYAPSEADRAFLRSAGVTTIIDLRGEEETEKKPSGFAQAEGFSYYHFPIGEGSGIPSSPKEVPKSYMRIAGAERMPEVFRCIIAAQGGVMFNCTAGKDRTGVVAAILLLHAGVPQETIAKDYALTRVYARERLELVRKRFPEIDMNIVTPCEAFMREFLRLFLQEYISTQQYFLRLGLSEKEAELLRSRLV